MPLLLKSIHFLKSVFNSIWWYFKRMSAQVSLISFKCHQIVSTQDRAKHCFENEWTLVDSTKYLPLSNGDSVQKPLFAFKTIFTSTLILHFREACQNSFHDNFSVIVHLAPTKLCFLPIPFSLGWFK
jgi:hypothetical protein